MGPKLTPNQLQRIEENRRKALEKLQQRRVMNRGGPVQASADSTAVVACKSTVLSSPSGNPVSSWHKGSTGMSNGTNLNTLQTSLSAKKECTSNVKQIIEEKKKRALERLKSTEEKKSLVTSPINTSKTSFSSDSSNLAKSSTTQSFIQSNSQDKAADWKKQFSYQPCKSNAVQSSKILSQQSSLVSKINEASIREAKIFCNSPEKKQYTPSHKAGELISLLFLSSSSIGCGSQTKQSLAVLQGAYTSSTNGSCVSFL